MHKPTSTWVVYRRTIHKQGDFPAVCPQREWDQMERSRPGYHRLLHAGVASESEADRLARGAVGDVAPAPPTLTRPRWAC
jgi:hypothetical protein